MRCGRILQHAKTRPFPRNMLFEGALSNPRRKKKDTCTEKKRYLYRNHTVYSKFHNGDRARYSSVLQYMFSTPQRCMIQYETAIIFRENQTTPCLEKERSTGDLDCCRHRGTLQVSVEHSTPHPPTHSFG